ncbi:MAG: ATP synthase subunit I [Planctomycetaceae bacterium]|nr:ATP synthase subunit I [Planctomycetaceae bacterium]
MMAILPTVIWPILGAVLGLMYFGGLWWTVKRLPHRQHPYVLLVASFMIRITMLLLAFWLMVQISWQALAMAMIGFLSARQVLLFRMRRQTLRSTRKRDVVSLAVKPESCEARS